MKSALLLLSLVPLALIAGCIPQNKTGFFVKNGEAVYVTVQQAPGSPPMTRSVPADAATFSAVASLSGADKYAHEYATDSKQVFIGALTRSYLLAECDPASFSILTVDGKYARDANHVYYCGIMLKDADPATFKVLAPPFAKDSMHAYAGAAPIDVLDAATFEVVHPGESGFPLTSASRDLKERDQTNPRTSIWGWARDSEAYYYADHRVKRADRESFKVLNLLYAVDKNHVYHARKRNVIRIEGADPATFELVGPGENRGRDRDHEYSGGERTK